MQRFSLTISQVLLAYANEIRRTFEHVGGHDYICSILMNNIQQLRLYLERLYESMGAAQLDDETKSRLKTLQEQLKDVLEELSIIYIKSIEPTIRQTIEEANKQLKQGNNSEKQKEVEAVLVTQSLANYLDER